MTASKIAKKAGVSRLTASRYLKGECIQPSSLELLQRAHAQILEQAWLELVRLVIIHNQNKES